MKYSKISNYVLKKIIKHFVIDISASKTSELLEINRNTINRYYMIFRKKIYQYQIQRRLHLLGWEVELDESYFGAKRVRWYATKLKRWRGTLKQPVFWLLERNWEVFTEIIPNCKAKTLRKVILWKVDIQSVIYTDWRKWYNWLVDMWYEKHYRVIHSKHEFARGKNHINWIENFRSFAKRRLKKFNWVKKQYFDLHLKECERRYWKSHKQLQTLLRSILNSD